MKVLFITLISLFTFALSAQSEWVGTKLKTDILIGKDQCKDEITLNTSYEKEVWGDFIVFSEDGTFKSFNQLKCGNECRMKVSGTFNEKEGEIEIVVHEVKYMDACILKPKETKVYSYGIFKLDEKNGNFIFSKID